MLSAPRQVSKGMAVSKTADIIIQGGQILTMDAQRPAAEAIAIIANRIAAVGTVAEIGALRGPQTHVIEARGGSVLPGFNEGHMHLFLGAAALSHLQLRGVHGLDDLERAIQDYDRANPGDGLIIGQSADYTILSA